MEINKSPRNLDIVRSDALWFLSYRFASDIRKVRAKNLMSIGDVSVSNGAVFEEVETYQTLKITFGRGCNHAHKTSGGSGLLDLFLGKSIVVVTNSCNVQVVIRRRIIEGQRGIINQHVGCSRVISKIEGVEAFSCRAELDYPMGSVNFENSPLISAIICYPKFLAEAIKRENVSYPSSIKINRVIAEGGLLSRV